MVIRTAAVQMCILVCTDVQTLDGWENMNMKVDRPECECFRQMQEYEVRSICPITNLKAFQAGSLSCYGNPDSTKHLPHNNNISRRSLSRINCKTFLSSRLAHIL